MQIIILSRTGAPPSTLTNYMQWNNCFLFARGLLSYSLDYFLCLDTTSAMIFLTVNENILSAKTLDP